MPIPRRPQSGAPSTPSGRSRTSDSALNAMAVYIPRIVSLLRTCCSRRCCGTRLAFERFALRTRRYPPTRCTRGMPHTRRWWTCRVTHVHPIYVFIVNFTKVLSHCQYIYTWNPCKHGRGAHGFLFCDHLPKGSQFFFYLPVP